MIKHSDEEYGILEMPQGAREQAGKYKPKTKRALYINTKFVQNLFEPSSFDPRVWVTDHVEELVRLISHYGKIGSRLPEGTYKGLEDDPSKQQIILYTIVLDNELKHILFYRRATSKNTPKKLRNIMGDKRLQGKGSIGFGGHIEHIDQFQWRVLSVLIPGFYQQIRRGLSLEIARIREFEEELGINGTDLSHFFLAKAFRQVYSNEELEKLKQIPVGAVHTCICAVAILNTQKLIAEERSLVYQKREIGEIEWMDIEKVEKFITSAEKRGDNIEDWSKIFAHFLPDILIEAHKLKKSPINA